MASFFLASPTCRHTSHPTDATASQQLRAGTRGSVDGDLVSVATALLGRVTRQAAMLPCCCRERRPVCARMHSHLLPSSLQTLSFCLTSPSCMQHQAPSSLRWRPLLKLQFQLLMLLVQCPQLQLHLLILLHQGCLQQTALAPVQPLKQAAQGCVQLLIGRHARDCAPSHRCDMRMTTEEPALQWTHSKGTVQPLEVSQSLHVTCCMCCAYGKSTSCICRRAQEAICHLHGLEGQARKKQTLCLRSMQEQDSAVLSQQ